MEIKPSSFLQIKDVEPPKTDQDHLKKILGKFLVSYNHIRKQKGRQGEPLKYFGLSSIVSEGIGWANAKTEEKAKFENFNRVLEDTDLETKEKETLAKALISADTLFEDLLGIVDYTLEHGPTKDKQFLIECAEFNQRFAYALYSEITYSKPKTTNAHLVISMLEALSDREEMPGSEQFRILLHGVKAQAGLMDLLRNNNYFIRSLNWQDPNEIKLFDLNGIDVFAVSPKGRTFLIDVKGHKYNRKEGSHDQPSGTIEIF